jgi:hypothetical protein
MGEAADDDDSGEEGSEDDDQDHEDETPAPPSQAPIASSSTPVVEMTDAPEIAAPAEPVIVTEASTAIPLESLQPQTETEQSILPSAPKSEEPTTETAAVEAASTVAVTVEAPVVEKPAVEAPTVEASAVEVPAVQAPLAEASIAEVHIAEQPVAKEPVVEEPVAEAPIAEAPAVEAAATVSDTSNSTDLPSHAGNPSMENSISQPPTSTTAIKTGASEPLYSEPAPAPIPSTETGPLPTSVDVSAGEPAGEPISTIQAEPTEAPAQEQPSVPPSAGTPDLLGSLEAELDKKE